MSKLIVANPHLCGLKTRRCPPIIPVGGRHGSKTPVRDDRLACSVGRGARRDARMACHSARLHRASQLATAATQPPAAQTERAAVRRGASIRRDAGANGRDCPHRRAWAPRRLPRQRCGLLLPPPRREPRGRTTHLGARPAGVAEPPRPPREPTDPRLPRTGRRLRRRRDALPHRVGAAARRTAHGVPRHHQLGRFRNRLAPSVGLCAWGARGACDALPRQRRGVERVATAC